MKVSIAMSAIVTPDIGLFPLIPSANAKLLAEQSQAEERIIHSFQPHVAEMYSAILQSAVCCTAQSTVPAAAVPGLNCPKSAVSGLVVPAISLR
jgi:hypothetical protein